MDKDEEAGKKNKTGPIKQWPKLSLHYMQGEKTGDKERRRKTKIIHLDAVSQMYAWPPSKELVKRIKTMKVALKKAMKQEAMKNPMRKAQGTQGKLQRSSRP